MPNDLAAAPIPGHCANLANCALATRVSWADVQDIRWLAGPAAAQRARIQPSRAGPDAGHLSELSQPDRARRAAADGGRAAADHRGLRRRRDVLRLAGRHPAARRAARGHARPRPRCRRGPVGARRRRELAPGFGARAGQSAPPVPAHHHAAGGRHRGPLLRRQRQRVDHHASRRGARLLLRAAELPARAGHGSRGADGADAHAPRRSGARPVRPADVGARRPHQANRSGRQRPSPL